jgi:hypothetical protein
MKKGLDHGANRRAAAQTRARGPHQKPDDRLPPLKSKRLSLPWRNRLVPVSRKRLTSGLFLSRGWVNIPVSSGMCWRVPGVIASMALACFESRREHSKGRYLASNASSRRSRLALAPMAQQTSRCPLHGFGALGPVHRLWFAPCPSSHRFMVPQPSSYA